MVELIVQEGTAISNHVGVVGGGGGSGGGGLPGVDWLALPHPAKLPDEHLDAAAYPSYRYGRRRGRGRELALSHSSAVPTAVRVLYTPTLQLLPTLAIVRGAAEDSVC